MPTPITPRLLSARPHPRPRRVGIAVCSGPTGLAWAVAGEAVPVVAEPWSGAPMEAVAHALTVAIDVHGGEPTEVQVVMDDAASAVHVRDQLAGLPWLTVYAQTGALGHDARDAARQLAGSATPPPVAPAVVPDRTTVATDGSCSRRAMGMAWVTTDGRYGAHATTDRRRCALTAELSAIRHALTSVAGRRVHLLVDSTSAIALVRQAQRGVMPRHVPGPTYQLVSSLVPLLAHRPVTISWVRAHNGHPLNEAADRLAVAARRSLELGQPAAARDLVFAHIVNDLQGAA